MFRCFETGRQKNQLNMKPTLLKITLLMLCFSTLIVHGQSKLIIHEQGGATQSFLLSAIKKLTFADDFMLVERKTENTIPFSIPKIASMSFQSSVNIIEKQNESLSIYPNPVTNNVTVSNSEIIDELKIFDMQGKIYLHLFPKQEIINIDMTSFSAGLYFLQIISNNQMNTSKIIKNY